MAKRPNPQPLMLIYHVKGVLIVTISSFETFHETSLKTLNTFVNLGHKTQNKPKLILSSLWCKQFKHNYLCWCWKSDFLKEEETQNSNIYMQPTTILIE